MRNHREAGRLSGWAICRDWRRYSTGRTSTVVAKAAAAAWKAEKQPRRRDLSSLSRVGKAEQWTTAGKVWGKPLTDVRVMGAWVMAAWQRRQVRREGGNRGRSTGRKAENSDWVEARAAQMPQSGPRPRESGMSGPKAAREG